MAVLLVFAIVQSFFCGAFWELERRSDVVGEEWVAY
jgi:hypothetical protein